MTDTNPSRPTSDDPDEHICQVLNGHGLCAHKLAEFIVHSPRAGALRDRLRERGFIPRPRGPVPVAPDVQDPFNDADYRAEMIEYGYDIWLEQRRVDHWLKSDARQPRDLMACDACHRPTRRWTAAENAAYLSNLAEDIADLTEKGDLESAGDVLLTEHIFAVVTLHGHGICRCPGGPRPPKHGYHLYRLWTADARLMYVGVSVRLRDRLRTHRRRWGHLWTHATWEAYSTAEAMMAAEALAIETEYPALNKDGV